MPTLVSSTGARLPIALSVPAGTIIDSFDRADGPLGDDWTDGADYDPTRYEPLGIHNGSVVCRLPLNRATHGVTYAADQIPSPPPDGQAYLGIGCAWRETGLTDVAVTCRWSGLWDTNAGHHCEAAPLLYVKPGTVEHGIGVWTSEIPFGPGPVWIPFLLVAALGNPPELFGEGVTPILAVAGYTHTDGQKHDITMTGDGATVSVILDGVPVLLSLDDTLGGGTSYTVPIPPALLGSTAHGFAVDTHFVSQPRANPATATPTLPVIEHVDIRPAA